MPFGIGWMEMLILLLVILLVFGPKRLPEMGRSLGRGMREFKDSISGKDDDEPVQVRQAGELPAPDPHPAEHPHSEAPASRERDTVS